jgi:hypothetical protein
MVAAVMKLTTWGLLINFQDSFLPLLIVI